MNELVEFGQTDYNIIIATYQRFEYILKTLSFVQGHKLPKTVNFGQIRACQHLSYLRIDKWCGQTWYHVHGTTYQRVGEIWLSGSFLRPKLSVFGKNGLYLVSLSLVVKSSGCFKLYLWWVT